jgi:hypothetical protein
MERHDPEDLAYLAIIGISLVLIGAILTPGTVGIAERGSVLAGIVGALFLVAYRYRKRHGGDG